MKFGVNVTWALGSYPKGDDYINLAQHAEKLGFNTFLVGDHVIIPNAFDPSNYPYADLGFTDLTPWCDPYVLLAAIAGATSTILLGTGITVVPYRPPIQQAQAIATLDFMSGGRYLHGIGLGWMQEEFDALNIPYKERAPRTREYIEVMKLLWSGDNSPYEGRFLSFPGGRMHPTPVQKPHPPIIVGGEGAPAYKRIAEIGDGFQNIFRSAREFSSMLDELGPMMRAAGRDLSELNMQLCTTDVDEVRRHKTEIPELEAMGAREIIFTPKCSSPREGFEILDEIAEEFIREN